MTTEEERTDCPICRTTLNGHLSGPHPEVRHFECSNCGPHAIATTTAIWLWRRPREPLDVARLAYLVRKLKKETVITTYVVEDIEKTGMLPGPVELVDNLVMHLADNFRPGVEAELIPGRMLATLGAACEIEASWAFEQAQKLGWLQGEKPGLLNNAGARGLIGATLSMEGRRHHTALMRDGAGSRNAFMAMDFNDPELLEFVTQHLQPAVKQTGFELRTTNHPDKAAGLIDNRMRVELRTSRFVVCDLTHSNRGAYWEAGFAEGLGRPVIYICRHNVLSSTDKATRPHFDTAHQSIVSWNPADPLSGLAELKAMIRATLPAEAVMEDPPAA